jgi:ClpP class serine protease
MNDEWLLSTTTLEALRVAPTPTAQQQMEFEASLTAANEDGPRILSRAGDTARIEVEGVLTKTPSWMARWFGGGNTTYSEITTALAAADADPQVGQIEMSINSGGGTVDGMFDTMAAMQMTKKPITATVSGMAASAAYGLASQAKTIVATSKAARFGSVGVAVTMQTSEDEVTITSSNASKKRPDVTTEAGVEMVREELDGIEALFIEDIAAGRGTTSKNVIAKFGEGAVLLAAEAKERGMIDSVSAQTNQPKASRGEQLNMDTNTLKAEHPKVYAEVFELGTKSERERVEAHLTLGEASGALETATKAIREGTGFTVALQAEYTSAGIKKAMQANVEADDADAGVAADQPSKEEAKTQADQEEATILAGLKNPSGDVII